MIVIFETGGKQFKAKEGDRLAIEKISSAKSAKEGKVFFDKVLLIGDEEKTKIGNPYLKGAKVEAKIIGEKKGDKKIIIKHKSKKRYLKKQGHRQVFTEIEISKIIA